MAQICNLLLTLNVRGPSYVARTSAAMIIDFIEYVGPSLT